MSSRSSRIPRSATSQTNENAAPAASSKPSLAGKSTAAPATRSRIPSASSLLSKQNASRLPKSSSARTLRPTPSQAQLLVRGEPVEPTPAYSSLVGIALQLPTSDDAVEEVKNAFLDERDDEQVDEEHRQQMPTPPNSQSPPKGGKKVERSESGGKLATATASRLPRTRTASSSQLAPPAASKPRRSSRSPSAQILDEPIPAGPAHAPHVIAARRRSSISPLPPPAQSSSQTSLAKGTSRASLAASTSSARVASPKPSATATSASSAKKTTTSKRTKLRPRPSEILPEPITLDSSEDDGLDDPLLLYGPEQTRGRGEGKQGTSRAGFRRAAGGTPVPGKGVLRRASDVQVEVKEESMEKEEQEMEMEPTQEEEDAQPVYSSDAPVEQDALPDGFAGDEQQEHPQEDDFGGGFDDHHYQDDADFAAGFDQREAREEEQADLSQYGQTDGFLPLQDPSSGSEGDSEEEQQHFEEEEEERKSPSPPLPAAINGDTQPLPSADVDVDAPSSDITYASPSPPHSPRQRGRPLQARPSYPPLDPEESGEWDAEVPVRLGSSPVRGESREVEEVDEGDEEEEADEVDEEVEQVEEVKVELEVEVETVEEAILEQNAYAAAPETADAALAVPAPPSTGYRSPSPAVLSPFFRRPASISPAPKSVPRRSTPSLSFASPRLPRDRYPHLAVPGVPSPAGAAIAPRSPSVPAAAPLAAPPSSAAASSRSWTRGPAFFRSSSFSPPPHGEQPRSATLFTRHPGRDGSEAPSATGEQSREYHRFGDLTPTSPHVDEIRELREEIRAMGKGADEEFEGDDEGDEQDEEEEEEEQVVLVGDEEQALERARSKSISPPRQPQHGAHEEEEKSAPPTPAKDYDIRMSSPAASIRSRLGSSPSPPRSPNGDVLMSSPSPRAGSPVAQQSPLRASFANSPSPPSLEYKKLPATPSAAGAHEADMDAKMGSPSPAKMVASGSGSMRRIGGIVEVGREKLQGLLFGPRGSVAEAEQVEQVEEPEQEEPEEEDEDDQPFPQPAHLAGPSSNIPRAPVSVADESTFSASHSNSNLSVISSTSRRSRRRRSSRPSHPTLPVIEISSTDAKAAARAAAILKCYHDYIEQGVEAVEAGEKSVRRVDAAAEGDEEDEDEEEELRTLLLDAEDEVRAQLPRRRRSESAASPSDDGTASSGTPPAEQPAPQPAAPSTDQLRRTSTANSTLSSIVNTTSWTSSEWRRLEQTLVEVGRRYRRGTSVSSISAGGESFVTNASAVGEEVDAEVVVEAFLRKWGVAKEECEGQWAWATLVTRVNALKTRRAKDVRLKRASSVSSTSTSLYSKAPLPPPSTQRKSRELPETLEEELRRASSPVSPDRQDEQEQSRSDEEEEERSPSLAPTVVKQEAISEHGGDEPSGDVTSSDEEEDHESRQLEDDTFFGVGRSTKERRARRTSVQPVYLPTALSNPALRHLYDDSPPEKVKVPVRDYLRDDSPSSADGEDDEPAEHEQSTEEPRQRETTTPEQDDREPSQPPSSASRLFSYLGSFVRRSPAPEPSPSSTRVAPPTPAAGSPEGSLSPSPEQPEMSEVKLHASVVTPRFASTSKAFPPVPGANKSLPHPGDRKILPLPPSHFPPSASSSSLSTPQPVASTSKVTLDGPSGARTAPQPFRRRRRSSGENSRVWEVVNAIEEAESSREEEEARIIELLQSGGAKRRAAAGDLREREEGSSGKGKGKAREVEWRGFVEVEKSIMIPAGTRALDRRPSGELRATRR